MSKCWFDITYHDLNPTILFVSSEKMLYESPYHNHNFTEITYIMSGKGQYYVDGNIYNVEAGDLLICNPGTNHHNIVLTEQDATDEFFVGFTDYHFRNMPPNTIQLSDGGCLIHTDTTLHQALFQHCQEMIRENKADELGKYLMLKTHLIQFLLLIIRQYYSFSPEQESYPFENRYKNYIANQIIGYLDTHYPEKISLDRIAQTMYLSPVYISKIFKEATGESPINYLIKIRLEKATYLLSLPDAESIKSIARQVGYEDAYHFSKIFKKYYGFSPLHYRNHFFKHTTNLSS